MSDAGNENRIIGGMFGLPDLPDSGWCAPPFIGDRNVFLANARSGVFLLVDMLSPERVWAPSYLCHTILDGARTAGGRVEFYGVDYDLRMISLDWMDDIRLGDLVIFIDYFGWPCERLSIAHAREHGAWVLEDACQSMLSDGIGSLADFVLFSPRKYLGVPDGALLRSNNPKISFEGICLVDAPDEWRIHAFSAALLRRESDVSAGSGRWYEVYRQVDSSHPIGCYRGSQLSWSLLNRGFDYGDIARRRVENYRALAAELGDIAAFPDIPAGGVPLGFPIRHADRDRIRQALIDARIYPPIHWPIDGVVPEHFIESHRLSRHILTLPCDHRYDASGMSRIARIVLEELN